MNRLILAFLGAACLLMGLAPSAFAFEPQSNSSIRALQWLHTHQSTDGAVFGDATDTEYTILGLAANHFSVSAYKTNGNSPLDYLAAKIGAEEKTAGSIAQLVLAVTAAGANPRSFGGHDLLQDLEATYNSQTGEFGAHDSFGDALSVLALRSAALPVPATALKFLNSQQCSDGGWFYDTTQPCGTPATVSDTNTTAVAVMALQPTAIADEQTVTHALAYLKTQQQPSGGFQLEAGIGGSDPDSDGLAIQALLAAGQDPTAAAWSIGQKNALTDLLSFQACDGAFSFPGVGPDNALATTQPLAALGSRHLPVAAAEASTDVMSAKTSQPSACVVQLAQTGGSPAAWIALLFLGTACLVAGGRLRRRLN